MFGAQFPETGKIRKRFCKTSYSTKNGCYNCRNAFSTPLSVFTRIGKNAASTIIITLDPSPMPAHMIINGIHAIIGIYLITVIVGVRSSHTVRNIPTSDPRKTPNTADPIKPFNTRNKLINRSVCNSLLCIISTNACPTIGIVGRIPVGISLYVVAKYHANIIKTGITKASVVFRAVFSFFIFHTS